MTFKVIDTKTGKEPTSRVVDNIAKKGGLMRMDIDQFFVGEDGSLVLADDCGNMTYCDIKRFKVVVESEDKEIENDREESDAEFMCKAMSKTVNKSTDDRNFIGGF